MQAAIDRVVKEGHRVLALVRHDESVVLLVGAAPPGHPLTTYRVVMARQNRLDAALNRAGDEGFGIGDVPPSEWKDDALVLLERGPVAAPRLFRTTAAFRGVSRTQDQLPSNELDQWFADGFRPVAIVAGRIVLQGEVRGQAPDRPVAGSHLVIRGRADAVRAQVEEAATRGYEPVAFGARKDEVVVVMARSASGAARGATLVTTSDGLLAMQTTINAAAADGWQLWRNRVLVRDQWTLAAMVHSAEPPSSYGLLGPFAVDAIASAGGEGATTIALVDGTPGKTTFAVTVSALVSTSAPPARAEGPDAPASAAPKTHPPVASFDQLPAVTSPGTKVILEGPQGTHRGRIVGLTDRSITLEDHGYISSVSSSAVRSVRERDRSLRHLAVGSVIGGSVGLGVGIAKVVQAWKGEGCRNAGGETSKCYAAGVVGSVVVPALTTGAGIGIVGLGGALIGRMVRGQSLLEQGTAPAVVGAHGRRPISLDLATLAGPDGRPAAALVIGLDLHRRGRARF
ncbi:MAG: hypothetical protein AB7N65_13685 [Vicinamibacterales bacterium]